MRILYLLLCFPFGFSVLSAVEDLDKRPRKREKLEPTAMPASPHLLRPTRLVQRSNSASGGGSSNLLVVPNDSTASPYPLRPTSLALKGQKATISQETNYFAQEVMRDVLQGSEDPNQAKGFKYTMLNMITTASSPDELKEAVHTIVNLKRTCKMFNELFPQSDIQRVLKEKLKSFRYEDLNDALDDHDGLLNSHTLLFVLKALLYTGANVNEPDVVGRYPIHRVAQSGKKEIMKLLLQAGADTDVCYVGENPMQISVKANNRETTQLLLEKAARELQGATACLALVYKNR